MKIVMMTKIAKSDLSVRQLGRIESKMVFEKPAEGTGISNSNFFLDFFDGVVRQFQTAHCFLQSKSRNKLMW